MLMFVWRRSRWSFNYRSVPTAWLALVGGLIKKCPLTGWWKLEPRADRPAAHQFLLPREPLWPLQRWRHRTRFSVINLNMIIPKTNVPLSQTARLPSAFGRASLAPQSSEVRHQPNRRSQSASSNCDSGRTHQLGRRVSQRSNSLHHLPGLTLRARDSGRRGSTDAGRVGLLRALTTCQPALLIVFAAPTD